MLVTSRRDGELLQALASGLSTFVIPNGVDTSYFAPSSAPPEPADLVFTGMMAYRPNYDGILYFLDEIFPLIRAVVPVGRAGSALSAENSVEERRTPCGAQSM